MMLNFEQFKKQYTEQHSIDTTVLAALALTYGIQQLQEAIDDHIRYEYARYMTKEMFGLS